MFRLGKLLCPQYLMPQDRKVENFEIMEETSSVSQPGKDLSKSFCRLDASEPVSGIMDLSSQERLAARFS